MHLLHNRFVAFGIALGLLCGGLAINAGCPQFFTAQHFALLRESFNPD
jgi:hypothetical protein